VPIAQRDYFGRGFLGGGSHSAGTKSALLIDERVSCCLPIESEERRKDRTGLEPDSSEALLRNSVIQLTRLNTKPLIVNSDLIEFIENAPDTVITFVTGEKIMVRETAEEVIELILRFRRRLLPTLATLPPVIYSERAPDNDGTEIEDTSGG